MTFVRIAILSDVHSNLEALESVARRMGELNLDRCLCLGDVVGYGGSPNECVSLVRRLADATIAGNHDHAALGITDMSYFNARAQAAARWTAETLNAESCEFLSGLPLVLVQDSLYCVHASPKEPAEWQYVLNSAQAETAFEHFEERFCHIGHSHRPLVAVKRGEDRCQIRVPVEVELEEDCRYILNGGSVGQPRDGDARASFLLLDTDQRCARVERVSYDIDAAQQRILDAGLPAGLAERLRYGW